MKFTYDQVKKFPKVSGFYFSNKKGFFLKDQETRKYQFIESQSVTTNILYAHFEGILTLGLYKHPNTKNIIIDIDKRQNTKVDLVTIVNKLVSYLGKPFYIEWSKTSDGYHLYYRFKEYVSDDALRYLKKHFLSQYNYVIDPLVHNHNMRLPYSMEYRCAGHYHDTDTILPLESFEEFLSIFSNVKSLPMPNIFFGKNVWGEVVPRESESPIERKRQKDYTYGSGERIPAQIEIAFSVLNSGGTASDYIKECEKFDVDSKDMRKPILERDAYILKIFYWAQSLFKPNTKGESQFTDGVDLSTDLIYDKKFVLSEKVRSELQYVLEFYAPLYTSYTNEYLPIFIDNVIKFYTQVYGKFLYDQSRPDRYIIDNLLPLNAGCLLPKTLIKQIADEFQIKNVNKIVKFLRKIKLLNLLKSKDGYSKSYKGEYRWAHHYLPNLTKLNKLYLYIYSYLNTLLLSTAKRYKLYSKLVSHIDLKFMKCNQYILENRPPPDGLESMSLIERLRVVDKKLKTAYII